MASPSLGWYFGFMTDVTRILSQIEQGDPTAADQLLPLIYNELRKLAAARLAQEQPGQTLQATALVHEAYLRLVDTKTAQEWHSRGHFFAAAAEAMRRILVERARRKKSQKGGGNRKIVPLDEHTDPTTTDRSDELLAVHEALDQLQQHDVQAAELVKLRYFVGMEHQEAANALGIGRRAADRLWVVARAWLHHQIHEL